MSPSNATVGKIRMVVVADREFDNGEREENMMALCCLIS
jgi:hypothetical protein